MRKLKDILRIGLFVIGIGFCCSTNYVKGEEEPKPNICEREVSGGRKILTGEHKGEIGYKDVSNTNCDYATIGVVNTITCSGRGSTTCPPSPCNSILTPDIYNGIIAKVYESIDCGKTEGYFEVSGLSCTWSDGEKNKDEDEDEDEDGVFIYSYKLEIKEIISTIPVLEIIQVFPNPVINQFSIRFSMPIDAMMNIRIVDMSGNTRWETDSYVSGNELHIDDIAGLLSGVYHVVCRTDNITVQKSLIIR